MESPPTAYPGLSQRASATGLVISGFGLSAFIFSVIAHAAFTENVSSFLLLLSLGTSLPMIVGYFFIRIIPLPSSERARDPEHHPENSGEVAGVTFMHEQSSQTPLLAEHNLEEEMALVGGDRDDPLDYRSPQNRDSLELSPTRDGSPRRPRVPTRQSLGSAALLTGQLPNIHGKALFMTVNFWLLCIILSLCE